MLIRSFLNRTWLLFLLLYLVFPNILHAQKGVSGLQEGDFLFQDLDCGPLCDAIEAVTEGFGGHDFSHVALVIKAKDTLCVLEAIGGKVRITPMKTFLLRSVDTTGIPKVWVGRLLAKYKNILPKALHCAKNLIGKPYDDAFLPHNDRYYCAELFTDCFYYQGKALFPMQPMTFKDPNTGDFFPAWVDYYRQLNIPIPERKPGLNPGAISRAKCLKVFPFNWRIVLQDN